MISKPYLKKQGLEDKFHRVAGKTRINVKITETEADVTDLNFAVIKITPEAWQQFYSRFISIAKTLTSLRFAAVYRVVSVLNYLQIGNPVTSSWCESRIR